MKIVFLGTPQIACGFLSELHEGEHEIVGVISQPDKVQGRGLCLKCPPVKDEALKLCIPIFQPDCDEAIRELIATLKPDLCIAIAYGRFLKKDVLLMPKLGFLNIHFSLLPKYRGAAPVQHALINGEEKTGVTSFWIEEKMDTETSIEAVESSAETIPLEDLYKKAYGLYEQGLFAEATAEFDKLILAYPYTDYTDNALYWKGEINYSMLKFEEAIVDFKKDRKSVV